MPDELDQLMTDHAAAGLQPFHAMEILARAKALEAGGREHLPPGGGRAQRAAGAARARGGAQGAAGGAALHQLQGQIELRQGLAAYYSGQHGVARRSRSS